MILMSVDFPAPFSPSSAWISPASSLRETSSSAWIEPKRFEMPRISRTIRLDPVEVLGVPVEQLLLVRAARALRCQDHSIGVDLAQVGAEEDVDRPVRAEHDPVWAERFDAVHDPGPDTFDRPIVVDH